MAPAQIPEPQTRLREFEERHARLVLDVSELRRRKAQLIDQIDTAHSLALLVDGQDRSKEIGSLRHQVAKIEEDLEARNRALEASEDARRQVIGEIARPQIAAFTDRRTARRTEYLALLEVEEDAIRRLESLDARIAALEYDDGLDLDAQHSWQTRAGLSDPIPTALHSGVLGIDYAHHIAQLEFASITASEVSR